tara:strand:+ start:411 stop:905 length:495 start_codon:yes stop_codon:yes gene_type:complete
MNLLVKNNFLIVGKEKFPCAIGANGLTDKKKEGDLCTPVGEYQIKKIFYREDKLGEIKFILPSFKISKRDGWCDDTNSSFYNQHIYFPFEASAEHLYRDDDLYDIVCVLDYNLNPIISGKGSAIFLHVADKEYKSTHGCIAIQKGRMIDLARKLDKDSKITIVN